MKLIVTTSMLCIISMIAVAQFTYINPMPGTTDRNRETSIILKNGSWIDMESVQDHNLVEITGSKSGNHKWTARLSDDRQTVIIKPEPIFSYGETVTVSVNPNLKKTSGEKINGTSFYFNIRKEMTPLQEERARQAKREMYKQTFGYYPPEVNVKGPTRGPDTVITYPLDSQSMFTININNNPCPGQIFFNSHKDQTGPNPDTNSFTTIIENDGTIIWARDQGKEGDNFRIAENGYLTYFIMVRDMWMVMDSNYNIIDSFQMKNGYEEATNFHDMMVYPDGHIFMVGYDNRETDMTAYGGQPNATVQYLVLQELDANRDVVFEWRGEDPGRFLFTDANQFTSLTISLVDYVHCNSIERDFDGDIIISSRNMDELTKIDRETGNIIWRMGGEKNQFSFVNDNNTKHFASQHCLRRLDNGNIMFFNNGNKMVPQISSAKEYALDEVNKVATLVWYYEHPDVNGVKVFGGATGNAQRLPNGNTLIDWGNIPQGVGVPNHTEVDVNKNIKWEMTFETGTKSYQAHKYDWNPCSRPTGGLTQLKKLQSTSVKVDWTQSTGATSYDIQYKKLGNIKWKLKTATNSEKKLKSLSPETQYIFQIRSHCAAGATSGWTAIDTFQTKPQRLGWDEEMETEFELFPNPATSTLQISFELDKDQQVTISIFDMMGRMISRSTQLTNAGEHTIQSDISNLPAGFYFVELSVVNPLDQTGSVKTTKKFVKQ